MPLTIVVMGPCGCGKTEVGTLLAKQLDIPFLEGDNYHTNQSKGKMDLGTPLTDEDRWHWLKSLSQEISRNKDIKGCCVACSALKKSYRDILRGGDQDLLLVYLKGEKELIRYRMNLRKDHYMKPGMLNSQFKILEEPSKDEKAITISINDTVENICQNIINSLKHS